MKTLQDRYEEELEKVGLGENAEGYNRNLRESILELLKVLDSQGHSGASAGVTVNMFYKLALRKDPS